MGRTVVSAPPIIDFCQRELIQVTKSREAQVCVLRLGTERGTHGLTTTINSSTATQPRAGAR